MTYEQWYAELAALCVANYGVDLEDLPDQSYRDYYDAGMTPKTALADIAESEELEYLGDESDPEGYFDAPEEWAIDLEFEETCGEAFDYFDRFDF